MVLIIMLLKFNRFLMMFTKIMGIYECSFLWYFFWWSVRDLLIWKMCSFTKLIVGKWFGLLSPKANAFWHCTLLYHLLQYWANLLWIKKAIISTFVLLRGKFDHYKITSRWGEDMICCCCWDWFWSVDTLIFWRLFF